MSHQIVLSKKALRDLKKVPQHIALHLHLWIEMFDLAGLRKVQRRSSYHDAPLHGQRTGQRSIRLSRAYRAIYHIDKHHAVHFIEILEVNKHEY